MRKPRYRAAVLDGFTIVLDLIADEYVAVPQHAAATISEVEEVATCLSTQPDDVLFTDPLIVPRGRRDLSADGLVELPRVRMADWLRVFVALPPALWALRFGRPRTWIRLEGAPIPAATAETIDAARRFKSMRPFVPWLSRCLPHALLLRSYLARCGHATMLVIGVRLFPFEAHSWVQAGDVVLTDDVDLVAAYSIIAAG